MSSKYSSNAWKGEDNNIVHMKHCLFCYKTVEQCGDNEEDASGQLDRRSFTAAARLAVCNFFKCTTRLFGNSFDNTVCPCGCAVGSTWQDLLLCCQDCLTNVSKFNEYYDQIKCLEMRLSWKLEWLRNIMKYADKVPSRIKAFREGLDGLVTIDNSNCCEKCEHESSFTEISGLRQFIFKHCTKYLKGSYPKVQLVRKRCNDYSSGATCRNMRKKAKLGLEHFSNAPASDCEAVSVASRNSLSSSHKQQIPSSTSNPSVVDTSQRPPLLNTDNDNRFEKPVDNLPQEPSSISVPQEIRPFCSPTPDVCMPLHSSVESTPVQTSIKTEEQESNVKMEDDQCSLTSEMDTFIASDSVRLNTDTTADRIISTPIEKQLECPSGSVANGISAALEGSLAAKIVLPMSAQDFPDSSLEPSPVPSSCNSIKTEEQGNNINTENEPCSSSSGMAIDGRPRRLRNIHQCPICKMTFSTSDRLQHHQSFAHENRKAFDVESICRGISLHDDSTDSESSHDDEDDENQADNLSDSLSNGNIDFNENANSDDCGSSSESSKDVASDEDYKPSDVEMEDSADEYVSSSAEEQGNDKKEEICKADFGSCDCRDISPCQNSTHLIYKHSNGRITLSETDLQLLQLTTLRQLKLNIISNECLTDDDISQVCSVSSCSMKFNFPEELENHSKFHGTFSCELCDTVNEFAGDFAEHQLEHASSGKSCCKCDFAEGGQICIEHYITTHMNISDQPFNSCPICKQNFHGAFPIPLAHFVNCHDLERLASGSKPVECKVDTCHAYFLKKFQLTEHILSCHNNNLGDDGQRKVRASYRSIISKIKSKANCKKTDHGVSIGHARKTRIKHGRKLLVVNGISISDWLNKRGAKHVCSIPNCTQTFLTEYELQIHSKLHGDFSCHFCDKKVQFAKDLAMHELEHRRQKSTAGALPKEESYVKCSRCNKSQFIKSKKEEYIYHFLKKHLKLEMDCFRCPICMAPILGTFRSNRLAYHLKTTHDVSEIPPESVNKCDKCSAHFLKSFQLEKHVQQVHMPIPEQDPTYPCRNCGRQFKNKENLNSHYLLGPVGCRLSKEKMPFVCTAGANCGSRFETQEDLDRHLHYKQCKLMKAVVCQVCGNECLGKSALKIHMREHNKQKDERADDPQKILLANGISISIRDWMGKKGAKFECTFPNCTQKFFSEYELQNHSKLHGDFSCRFCAAKLKFAKDLAIHELEHKKEKSTTGSRSTKGNSIKCSRCNKNKFKGGGGGDSYIYHFLRKHLKLEMDCFRCPICMAPLLGTLRTSLAYHLKTAHNVSEIPPESVHKCDKCPAHYLKSFQLKKHVQQAHTPIPEQDPTYTCRNCGRLFETKRMLYSHYYSGSVGCRLSYQEMPFVCTARADCGNRFETQEELDWHLHYKQCKHTKAVVCQICEKVCFGEAALRMHMRSHNKQNKNTHVCDVCGKTFRHNSFLKNHMLSHSGPESWRFSCSVCSKKCATADKLKQHMNTHTKAKPFVCDVCGEKYAHRHNWRNHMKTKHGTEIPKMTTVTVATKQVSSRKGKKLKP